MTKTKNELYKIWSERCREKGWLRKLWLTQEYDEEDLAELERIDDEFLEVADREKQYWEKWKRENLPKTEEGWLEIFPDAKAIIPEKIAEWEEKRDELSDTIKRKLTRIKYRVSDEFSRWLWREWVKITDGEELLKAEGHVARLKRLLAIGKAQKPTGWITEQHIEQARAVPIENLINQPLRKCGKALVGLCPLHNERHPSFYVYPATNSCWCYGCNQGGDVINFIKLLHGYQFKEAVQYLTEKQK